VAGARRGEERPITQNGGKTVLAVASGGGHWTQLLRLRGALDGCEVVYVSTIPGHASQVDDSRYLTVPHASRWERRRAAVCAVRVAWIVLRIRPDVVISTGALPGFFAVAAGKVLLGRRTIWVDSIANAEEMSLSGRLARRFADVWLTQWEHLAGDGGPAFAGSVIN
jgi:exopolysaccharide biosynthesis glucuronosyltransferase PssD